MAKMFYTLEEAKAALSKSEEPLPARKKRSGSGQDGLTAPGLEDPRSPRSGHTAKKRFDQ